MRTTQTHAEKHPLTWHQILGAHRIHVPGGPIEMFRVIPALVEHGGLHGGRPAAPSDLGRRQRFLPERGHGSPRLQAGILVQTEHHLTGELQRRLYLVVVGRLRIPAEVEQPLSVAPFRSAYRAALSRLYFYSTSQTERFPSEQDSTTTEEGETRNYRREYTRVVDRKHQRLLFVSILRLPKGLVYDEVTVVGAGTSVEMAALAPV